MLGLQLAHLVIVALCQQYVAASVYAFKGFLLTAHMVVNISVGYRYRRGRGACTSKMLPGAGSYCVCKIKGICYRIIVIDVGGSAQVMLFVAFYGPAQVIIIIC